MQFRQSIFLVGSVEIFSQILDGDLGFPNFELDYMPWKSYFEYYFFYVIC